MEDIALVIMFSQWFLDIFNVKIQHGNNHQSIQIIHQVKDKGLLVICKQS